MKENGGDAFGRGSVSVFRWLLEGWPAKIGIDHLCATTLSCSVNPRVVRCVSFV